MELRFARWLDCFYSIKVTIEASISTINFLDVTLDLKKNNNIKVSYSCIPNKARIIV